MGQYNFGTILAQFILVVKINLIAHTNSDELASINIKQRTSGISGARCVASTNMTVLVV